MPEPGDVDAVRPGVELDGFVIEAVAGRGGMGVVYRARQKRPNRFVALKVISASLADHPEFRSRFQRESNIAAQIEHPNVIPVYAVGEADGVLYIAMRFVDGVDMRTLLLQEGRLEPRRAAGIADQVAQALDAAHAHGLVHRDVKPANILISRVGGRDHVYLSDFGLSRQVDGSHALTGTGAFLGTIDYVAPEQARGERVTAQTDVYSLGCVLFHALTGTVPFPLGNDLAKLYAHGAEPPPSPLERVPDLPAAFEPVLARAMAKTPDQRYLSAGDVGRAAIAAASGTELSRTERSVAVGGAAPPQATSTVAAGPRAAGVRAPGEPAPGTTLTPAQRGSGGGEPGRRRRPLRAAAVAALVVAVIVAVGVATLGGGRRPAPRPAAAVGGVQLYIRGDGALFAKDSLGLGRWTEEAGPGTAVNVAAGGRTQMIVRGDGAVLARDSIGTDSWTQETKAADATKIAASSSGVQMFVRRDAALFARSSIGKSGWTQETGPGSATGIAVGGNLQMFLRGDGAIFARTSIGRSGWTQEGPPGAIGIAASRTGLQMVLRRDGAVFARTSIGSGPWTPESAPGAGTAVEVGGATQMFLRQDGAVFAKNTLGAGGWTQETAPGAATAIGANDSGLQLLIRPDKAVLAKRTIGYGGWVQETGPGDAIAIATG